MGSGAAKGAEEYEGPYAHTPSQAEGERDEAAGRDGPEAHGEVLRTEPSQAEGDRTD